VKKDVRNGYLKNDIGLIFTVRIWYLSNC